MKKVGCQTLPGLALVACCATARASLLPAFEPVIVSSGDIVEHVIEIQEEAREGARVEIKLVSKPDGARILVNDNGQMILTWKTGPDLDDETALVIQARNVDTGDIIQTQELLVRNVHVIEENGSPASVAIEPTLQAGNPLPSQAAESLEQAAGSIDSESVELEIMEEELKEEELKEEDPMEEESTEEQPIQQSEPQDPYQQPSDSDSSQAPGNTQITIQPDTPEQDDAELYFDGVNNLIVSVGRTVSMRFDASSSDGEEPVLTIDRLPSNASFDKDFNGRYRLFWQTADRDQGEYIFKVTAQHPLDFSISKSMYWTLVIGDPSLGKSVPEDFDQ